MTRLRRIFTVSTVVISAAGVVGLIARVVTWRTPVMIACAAFAPLLMAAGPLALVIALAVDAHRRYLVLPIGVSCALLVTQVPILCGTPATQPVLHVMTANLDLGGADARAVVEAVRRSHIDVLAVEELTAPESAALTAAGLDGLLPYRLQRPRASAFGTGLWSRYPLQDAHPVPGFTFEAVQARVAVPGMPGGVTVLAVHLAGPWPSARDWLADVATLGRVLPAMPAPAVALGDLNATPDQAQFRSLLRAGFADAADDSGAGYAPTYPADRWYPPLLVIDHVLMRGLRAAAVRTVSLPGSDHRGLVSALGAH